MGSYLGQVAGGGRPSDELGLTDLGALAPVRSETRESGSLRESDSVRAREPDSAQPNQIREEDG